MSSAGDERRVLRLEIGRWKSVGGGMVPPFLREIMFLWIAAATKLPCNNMRNCRTMDLRYQVPCPSRNDREEAYGHR